jgi:hypothetical protein
MVNAAVPRDVEGALRADTQFISTLLLLVIDIIFNIEPRVSI